MKTSSSIHRILVWALCFAVPAAVGCGTKEEAVGDDDDDGGDDDDDAGDDDDDSGCVDDTACEPFTICDLEPDSETAGTCILGDRNNSPDEAVPLTLTTDVAAPITEVGMIAPPGDVDYFVYNSEGGEWVSLRTETDFGRDVLDTYVTVTDPDGDVHARLDNYPTGLVSAPLDTVLYMYLPEPGEYVVAVEDVTTAEVYEELFEEEDWRGDEDATYSVYIRAAGAVAEPDAADAPSVAVLLDDGGSITAIGVRMEDAGDTDHVQIDTEVPGQPLEVWVQPDRPGSIADAQLDLFDSNDTLVASKRAGAGDEGYLSYFDPDVGSYFLQASDGSGNSGPDAWYVLYLRTYDEGAFHPFFGDNEYTYEGEPNDAQGEGIPLIPQADATTGGETYQTYRFEGRHDLPGDVDRFTVDASSGDRLSVRCFTESFGSLLPPSVSLQQGGFDRTPKGQGTLPTTTQYYVWNAEVSGELDIQITADAKAASGLAAYYRCVAYVTPFDVDAGSR